MRLTSLIGLLLLSLLMNGCMVFGTGRLVGDQERRVELDWVLDPSDPLLEKRKILLFGAIDTASARIVITKLLYLSEKSRRPIDLFLMTPGGDMTAAIGIEQVIRSLRAPVNTIAIGECSSAGAFLLAAGTGERVALRGTTIVIHGMEFSGKPPAGAPENLQGYYTDFWQTRSRLPAEWLPLPPGQLHVFTAEQAKQFGIVDKVE